MDNYLHLAGMSITLLKAEVQEFLDKFCPITMDTLCKSCGERFGGHFGVRCPRQPLLTEIVDPAFE